MSLSVSFPGLVGTRRGTYTGVHGMQPGVAVVETVPQTISTTVGSLVLSDASTSLTLTGALLSETGVRANGERTIQVNYLKDRRWRWQKPICVGEWNVPLPDGTVDSATQKSARELVSELFDSMGETVDCTALPADDYPHVEWRGRKSWVECQELMARYGCDVAPNFFTDTFVVVRLNAGASLPTGGTEMSVSVGTSFDPWPDIIGIICGRSIWETKFVLQAVAPDTDGQIKAIDDLSYAPAEGWAAHGGVNTTGEGDLTNLIPTAGAQAYGLANRYIYRMYQIASIVGGELADGTIPASVEHCLPLERERLLTYNTANEQYRAPALVEGTFLIQAAPDALENSAEFTQVDTPFTINREKGYILFAVPVVKVSESNDQILPATLYLTTAHYVQDETKNFLRYYQTLTIASNGVPSEGRLREEYRAMIRGVYTGETLDDTITNETALTGTIDIELAAWANSYVVQSATAITYANLQAIGLSGKIRAVTWTVDCGDPGDGYCITQGTENSECIIGIIPRWARYRNAMSEPYYASSGYRRRRMRGRE
jgi:hypothetical protein